MILLADIGGTNARFRFETPDGDIVADIKLPTKGHDNFADAYKAAYDQSQIIGPVKAAFIAWAGPVTNGAARLTNHKGWALDETQLRALTGAHHVQLVNDFVAQMLAVPALTPAQIETVLTGNDTPDAPFVVIGPGTGLGVGIMSRRDGTGHVLPGEGGHVTLTARTSIEVELIAIAKQAMAANSDGAHFSAERFVSGGELWRLHQAVAQMNGVTITEHLSGEDIANKAVDGDPIAAQTINHFHDFLGTIASDLAVSAGARSGVWLTGDLMKAWRAAGLFDQERLITRFTDKGRFSDYCRDCGIYQVMADSPAFMGLRALYSSTSSA